jgi:hypothetical protein
MDFCDCRSVTLWCTTEETQAIRESQREFERHKSEAAQRTSFQYFKSRFGGPPQAAPAGGPGRGQAAGPQPPPGNPLEIVTAECDLVTIIHKNYRQDPTASAGTWYEVFTFDVFRVRNGKLVEHSEGAVINPPAPAGGRGQ